MTSLIITIAGFAALTVLCERILWGLFYRKMEPLRFPGNKDASGSHSFYLRRLRMFAIIHTLLLAGGIALFCITLW